ncbi:MAG: SDR family NAD(P)-dependent oxidoreductase [Albidovulum sp.]
MSLSIAGKTAIITGAASGIGLAIAHHFMDRGAKVMLADADEELLAEEMKALGGDESAIRAFNCDLCQKLAVANLLSATVDAFDRIDILVNASRNFMLTDPLSAEDQSVETLLKQNLMVSLRLSQWAAKRMIAQAERDGNEDGPVGSIINISPLAAQRSQPELLAYSVAGAALEQATRSLALALAPERIRVNGIAVGSVLTSSLYATLKENPDWRDEIIARTPLGRIASPPEVVDTALFLASDGSSFMTGQILTVDGGRSLLDPAAAPAY